jgi:two-component system sensor histidine kinase ChvG
MALDDDRSLERVQAAPSWAATTGTAAATGAPDGTSTGTVSATAGRLLGMVGPALAVAWVALCNTPPFRYLSRTLLRRILVSNLIGLGVLILGVAYVSMSHGWLLEAKRQSLQVQGQIIAAAIGENARDSVPSIAGPEAPEPRVPYRDDGFAALEFSLSPERVTPILNRIIKPTDARARIYDRTGNLVVDTAALLQRGKNVARPDPDSGPARPKTRNFYTRLTHWLIGGELPVYREIGNANGTAYPEVQQALKGNSTAVLLIDDDGEQIVAIAEPIRRARNRTVQGVLFLSTKPGEISGIVRDERYAIWMVVAFALLATLISSWLLARTVADPMRELSEAADNVSRSIAARADLPLHTNRHDEVGQLAAAFRAMTESLYRRIEASDKFAADVAHELKNPLAAARSTAESLRFAKTEEQRTELVEQIQYELKRLNRLINDVSNVSRLDAELARQRIEPVDLGRVIGQVTRSFADILSDGTRTLQLAVEPALAQDGVAVVAGNAGRLEQVLMNLIDNAISFSPENGVVTVGLAARAGTIVVTVTDQGPGIPEDRLEAVFERFYSDRPATDTHYGKNSGLGLSISREIVLSHGGRIFAENVYPRRPVRDQAAATPSTPLGARFTVELPRLPGAALRNAPAPGRRAPAHA